MQILSPPPLYSLERNTANLFSDSRVDLQIPDDQPHGLQIIAPVGILDTESTASTSNTMAPQGENRISVPASTASLSLMERVLDVAPIVDTSS